MRTIDVHEVIDNARFNRFHWMVLFWCALIIIFDGYDLVIYGVVLPMLMKEWGLSPLQAGALGSYALFGMMFGALFFGPLSDRIGRKKAITLCVILFSGFTVLNGFARNPTEFGICRFIVHCHQMPGRISNGLTDGLCRFHPRSCLFCCLIIIHPDSFC